MKIGTMLAGVAAGVALLFCAQAWAADGTGAAYAAKGEQTCLKCHDEGKVTDILKGQHALKGDSRTPFADHGCETCHGASPEHVASAGKAGKGEKPLPPAIRFGKGGSPVEARNQVCLGCHDEGMRMNWRISQHETGNVACTGCHTIHAEKDPVLVKATQPEKCFTCHTQQRAESFQISHHPIREGKVVCSDCHSTHGSAGPKLLKEFTLNETCFTCHTDKRGPFLWEHEPVREDCAACHASHGSNQTRLLKERPSFLCSTCHQEGGHQSPVYSANITPGLNGAIGATTTQGAVNVRTAARGCVNCHSQVHGSNSESGAFFTR